MSQNDLSIANQGFASFRSDLNSALQALGSTNSGTSAPSTTYANQLFYDTTNNILKIRNEDNDAFISLFTLDQSNDNIESLTVNGVLTADSLVANGGVTVDNITIDGTEIDLSSGDLTLDVAGDIVLDADGADIILKDGGTEFGKFTRDTSGSPTAFVIDASANNVDMKFKGIDAGSEITAMTIDMGGGGNVGIGIAPTSKFTINDSSALEQRIVHAGNGTTVIRRDGAVSYLLSESGVSSNRELAFGFQTSAGSSITETMRIDSSGNVGIGTSSPSGVLDIRNGTTQQVIIGNSGSYTGSEYAELLFKESSTELARLKWNPSGNTFQLINRIAGPITFATSDTERMRIDSSGKVAIGLTSALGILDFQAGTGTGLVARNTGSSGHNAALFINANDTVGSIVTSGTSTAFNTSSDYRLKENVTTSWDATTRLKRLKPSRFNFKTDKDTTLDGFLAHEVSSIVPEAITGTKDEVDTDGNPVHQGIDQSKLVPLLTKALQEAVAKIETLETKVTALEGK